MTKTGLLVTSISGYELWLVNLYQAAIQPREAILMPDQTATEKNEEQVAEPKKTRVILPPLDLTGASAAVVSPDVLAKASRPRTGTRRDRSKAQLVIDDLVRKAYDAWIKAGKPASFAASPGGKITVPAANQVVVESAIRKAGNFLNLSIRFGLNKPEGDTVEIVFKAADRKPKPAVEASAEKE
jgi:hypothetical protein